MTEDNDKIRFSRRKLLGSVATVGAAGALGGAATSALLWDEEKFGDDQDPNVLQAGQLDLKVDWEGQYFGDGRTLGQDEFLDETSTDESNANNEGEVDSPGPLVNLTDVKPGDVMELTLSSHVYGNPAFLGMHYTEHADTEGGDANEPERAAEDATADEDLDPDGGELDDYMQVVVWHDDGDNVPTEVWSGAADGDGNLDVETVQNEQSAEAAVDDNAQLIYAGNLDGVPSDGNLDSRNAEAGETAGDFPDTACYQNSTTEYIGVLAWLPRDIPGVNDNIVQGDRVEFQFGFHAIQCRHNVADDGGPADGTIKDADDENNAQVPDAGETETAT